MNELIRQFREIPTTCLSDALGGSTNLEPGIKPLREHYKIAGRAFTVKMPAGENLAVLRAIRDANPGDILVIDAKGDTGRAIAGDFILGMAQTLGIGGVVVDGVIRDILGIKELDFPVFCKGTIPAAGSKHELGELNVPVSCGGTVVNPGELIVGDVDGVVVIPGGREDEILEKALAKLRSDQERAERIADDPDKVRRYLEDFLGD